MPLPFWLFCILALRPIDAASPSLSEGAAVNLHTVETVKPVPGRGFYESPIRVSVQTENPSQLWYTTDGKEPGPGTGAVWPGALSIDHTTVLRLATFVAGKKAGATATHTYLFLSQVSRQNGTNVADHWGLTNGQPVTASYGMDPVLADATADQTLLVSALHALPSLSLVADSAAFFDNESGIYAHPMESGPAWERAASVEWLEPGSETSPQTGCGMRIQGGWNRRPEESPKHSFRLVFNRRYGPGKWRLPLFGGTGLQEFDTLILRAGCNNTWLHWNAEERRRGDYLRDQWMRDTLRAMGHVSARGMFVHLYLNGLYWGIYNLTERPDASFVAGYLGGRAKDYDARNGNHVLEGEDSAWKQLMARVNAGVAEPPEYDTVRSLLDIPQFIDYMLANLYGANSDWDGSSNWYAARRRRPPGPFQFFVWDAERTLESVAAGILPADDEESPMRLFQKLRQNALFRKEFSEHAQLHLSPEGALGPRAAALRFEQLAQQIEGAMHAESSRWGNYRHKVHPYKTGPFERYTPDEHWRPEIRRLLQEYFPKRTTVVIEQLREIGLYP